MAAFMSAIGSMGGAITAVKDPYKPSGNITSTWSSLAQNLVAVAGTVGLTALNNKVNPGSGSQPVLLRTASGVAVPSIAQPGVLGVRGIGSGGQTGLLLFAGAIIVGVVLFAVMEARK